MGKNVLISLVSDQTIPNVELIKELNGEIDKYIFVHSTQTKPQLEWIIKATKIEQHDTILVDAFNLNDIEDKLSKYEFEDDNYYLNITGGTKLMIIAFQDFFKNLGAKIFYVTGHDLNYVKVFPAIGQRNFKLESKISLEEYLYSYGFEYKASSTHQDFDQSKRLLDFFLDTDTTIPVHLFEQFRLHRSKNFNISENPEVCEFLERIGLKPNNQNKLNKYENKYLSGEWFEEFVFYKIKEELNLSDKEIGTGYNLTKQNTPNEIDVIFIYKNKLYIIECKTSIFDNRMVSQEKTKKVNLLPEIIYKSDALRNTFGLFANTSIFTLEEIKNIDGTPIKNFEIHFNRAGLSRINIVSKRDFQSKSALKDLLKISK